MAPGIMKIRTCIAKSSNCRLHVMVDATKSGAEATMLGLVVNILNRRTILRYCGDRFSERLHITLDASVITSSILAGLGGLQAGVFHFHAMILMRPALIYHCTPPGQPTDRIRAIAQAYTDA